MKKEKVILHGLQELYSEELSEAELCEASENLFGFVDLLVEIDLSQKQQ